MSEITNEIVQASAAQATLDRLASGKSNIVTTFAVNDAEDKVKLYNAISDPEPIADHLNEVIPLTDVVFQAVAMETTNDDGEIENVNAIQTILLSADGKAYSAMSDWIRSAIERIFGVFGKPSEWSDPLSIKVVEKRSKKNAAFRFYDISLAGKVGPAK